MSSVSNRRRILLATAAAAGLSATPMAFAQVPVVDGTRDAVYGNPFSVQTVNTGFGDNQSELDAGYARIENGKLYLMLSGNLESNFNKMVLFFDTRAGGQNVMRGDNPDIDFNQLNTRYVGMTFDTGFAPDYVLFWSGDANAQFLNFSELNTNGGGFGAFLGSVATPGTPRVGSGVVGGTGGAPLVEFGFNDANLAGVIGDGAGSAADQTAAAAVTTGSEISIDLTAIGATENFTMQIGINGSSHDFYSNQFLPGFTPPQGNLGSDGLGNFIPPGSVSAVNFNNIAGDQFLTVNYHAPLSEWNNAGNGNWNLGGNWSGDGVPNAPDARAVLGTLAGSAARVITLDTDVRLASLTFDSSGGYTISGTNTLTISGNPATPAVLVNSGNHTIGVPLVLATTTNFSVAAGSTLSVTGTMTATGQTVVKTSPGVVQFPNVVADRLFVAEGTVRIAPNGTSAGTSNVKSLGIAGDATPTATLDLTNNALVVDYTPPPPPPPAGPEAEPFDTIRAQIVNAYAGGSWTGTGITSSNANSSSFGVGYAEASDLTTVPAIFGTVDADAVLVRFTRYGDANLDGLVNLADFNRLAANFGSTTGVWSQGDFTYDANVNLQDFNRLAANFGLSAAPDGPTPQDWANLAAAIPEPSSLALVGLGAAALVRRRRA